VTSIRGLSSLLVPPAAAILLAACGGARAAATAGPKPGGGRSAVGISNFAFKPATVTVKRGARITVSNRDSAAHTATADDGHSFDTGTVDPGSSKTITLPRPGSFP
jgi:plastocyanin